MNREHRSHRSLTIATVGYAVAGLGLAAYPLLRPYSDERTLQAAQAWGSTRWLVSHLLAVLAFGALAVALRHAGWSGRQSPARAAARMHLALLGLLPYYGMETFALHALGRAATRSGDTAYIDLGNQMRNQPVALGVFALGILMLALVGGRLVQAYWGAGPLLRWAGVVAGLGLVLFLPQFFAAAWLRAVWGVVTGAGLMTLAVGLSRR